MAFLIDATMKGYRVLGKGSGRSKKGTEWRSLTVFRDGKTCELSTTDIELFPALDALNEMDVVNLDVRAVAGKERSYVQLIDAPVLVQAAAV